MTWINEIILGLLDTYGTNNPYELCDLLGITIRKVPSSFKMLAGDNSIYLRDYFEKEIIFIRNNLNQNHEEFYLRHELGHALLHVDVLNSSLCNKGKLELQANYFAVELSKIAMDSIELNEMTLEQIACCLELPYKPLKQVIDI